MLVTKPHGIAVAATRWPSENRSSRRRWDSWRKIDTSFWRFDARIVISHPRTGPQGRGTPLSGTEGRDRSAEEVLPGAHSSVACHAAADRRVFSTGRDDRPAATETAPNVANCEESR